MKKYLFAGLMVMNSGVNAAMISSYDFNGSLADSLGNGADMVASGGVVTADRYSFDLNQGLKLNNGLASITDYAIEMKLQVNDSLNGYNKVIDFQSLGADAGLYIYNGGVSFFSTNAQTYGSLSLNTDFVLGFARSGTNVQAYIDGQLMFDLADLDQAISPNNVLNFFADDVLGVGQVESFAGSVDYIRIHEDVSTFGAQPVAAPLPSAAWLFGAGLLGLVAARKKQA